MFWLLQLLSVSIMSLAAPAEWTLIQIVRFWLSGEPDRDGNYEGADEDDEQDPSESNTCIKYMRKLSSMGVQTRLQAQAILTDGLCHTLDETYGIPCDVRRELLQLLGVDWRKQVWSPVEIARWEHEPVEATAGGDDGPWREEVRGFRKMMEKLDLLNYWKFFHDDEKYKLLGIATFRNLLHYLCDADFERVGIPMFVVKILRAEALAEVTGLSQFTEAPHTGSPEASVCKCIGHCRCKGEVSGCRHGHREQLPTGQWFVFVGQDSGPSRTDRQEGSRTSGMQNFRAQVQDLREYLCKNETSIPSSTTSSVVEQRVVVNLHSWLFNGFSTRSAN